MLHRITFIPPHSFISTYAEQSFLYSLVKTFSLLFPKPYIIISVSHPPTHILIKYLSLSIYLFIYLFISWNEDANVNRACSSTCSAWLWQIMVRTGLARNQGQFGNSGYLAPQSPCWDGVEESGSVFIAPFLISSTDVGILKKINKCPPPPAEAFSSTHACKWCFFMFV